MNTLAVDGGLSGASDESQCFHNHAPQQLASGLAFHQQAADQLGGNLLGGAGEEGLGEVLGGRGGYGSGFGVAALGALSDEVIKLPMLARRKTSPRNRLINRATTTWQHPIVKLAGNNLALLDPINRI